MPLGPQTHRGEGPGPHTGDGCAVDLYLRLPYLGEVERIAPSITGPDVLELGGRFDAVILASRLINTPAGGGFRFPGVDRQAMGLDDKEGIGMSHRAELEQSWATTGRHLKAARELLHDDGPPGADGASLAGFEQCMRLNEMELALDELEDLGLTSAPPAEFWRHMMYAANNMSLGDRAAEYRRRMERS